MKKKLFLPAVALLFVIISVAISSPYQSVASTSESLLLQANIEALVQGEINPNCPNGCKDNGNGCYCNFWYEYYREAK